MHVETKNKKPTLFSKREKIVTILLIIGIVICTLIIKEIYVLGKEVDISTIPPKLEKRLTPIDENKVKYQIILPSLENNQKYRYILPDNIYIDVLVKNKNKPSNSTEQIIAIYTNENYSLSIDSLDYLKFGYINIYKYGTDIIIDKKEYSKAYETYLIKGKGVHRFTEFYEKNQQIEKIEYLSDRVLLTITNMNYGGYNKCYYEKCLPSLAGLTKEKLNKYNLNENETVTITYEISLNDNNNLNIYNLKQVNKTTFKDYLIETENPYEQQLQQSVPTIPTIPTTNE